jgi:hypothetical protein
MPILEGSHSSGSGGPRIRYHVDYEVSGTAIHFKATFDGQGGPSTHEGQFDFDPKHVDAASAVDAFMQNHIGKADFDVAP